MFRYFRYISILLLILVHSHFVFALELPSGIILVDGVELEDIRFINQHLKEGSRVYLGPGVYNQGFEIDKDNVTVSGDNTHFKNAAIQGKAVFIVSGENVRIENIECSGVEVRDKNGACVRQEAANLTLSNVIFRDSQQGVLTTSIPGFLKIKHSQFLNLGKSGRAHGVYSNTDELIIEYSQFIGAKDQAHSVKSRSKRTSILHSTISSGEGNDSRLLDISNGGTLEVSYSILHQGQNSVNGQLIGYGLERTGRNREHNITLSKNLLIAERQRGNRFLLLSKSFQPTTLNISNNVFVGRYSDKDLYNLEKANTLFDSRARASINATELPSIGYLDLVESGIIK